MKDEKQMVDPSGGMLAEGPFLYRVELTNGTSRVIESPWDEEAIQECVVQRSHPIPVTRQVMVARHPQNPRKLVCVVGAGPSESGKAFGDPLLEAVSGRYNLSPHEVLGWSELDPDAELTGIIQVALGRKAIMRPGSKLHLPPQR